MSNHNNITNDNRIEYNNRIFKLLADYNSNINTYNNNINFIITNLIRRNATNTTRQYGNISDIHNTPPLTSETPGPTFRPTSVPLSVPGERSERTRTALDNYLVRILELLNANTHTNTQTDNDNDLTISFSIMRELDDTTIPLYELIATRRDQEEEQQQHQVTPLIYDNTTRLIFYDTTNDNIDRICPISHENFEDGEQITQIKECGHIFKTDNIKRWLERSSYCPKCRYNIVTREYTTPSSAPV